MEALVDMPAQPYANMDLEPYIPMGDHGYMALAPYASHGSSMGAGGQTKAAGAFLIHRRGLPAARAPTPQGESYPRRQFGLLDMSVVGDQINPIARRIHQGIMGKHAGGSDGGVSELVGRQVIAGVVRGFDRAMNVADHIIQVLAPRFVIVADAQHAEQIWDRGGRNAQVNVHVIHVSRLSLRSTALLMLL